MGECLSLCVLKTSVNVLQTVCVRLQPHPHSLAVFTFVFLPDDT